MSTTNWRESDVSDEDVIQEHQAGTRKRSSRACDQCRKTKSKCERPNGDGAPCKSCAFTGTACTFLGPSYKRGPPKGYIHAIEQRWHQVECLLGALLQCPDSRVQSIIAELRTDELAREILNRVDTGPYGPSGRRCRPEGASKEDFFATVLKSSEGNIHDTPRSRRQSRVSREIVSSTQDHGLSVVPTSEWQDNLSSRLASAFSSYSNPLTTPFDSQGVPLPQRRRLNNQSTELVNEPNWNDLYTLESTDYDNANTNSELDPTEGMGQLSLDEDQEVRYHGKASGLHLLGRADRNDNRHEGGIWRMPMARVWPPSKNNMMYFRHEEDVDVHLPPIKVQDQLIELYIVYIHPVFPVLHKARFLSEYHLHLLESSRNTPSSVSSPTKPDFSQRVSKLLLLAIFAISARFIEDGSPLPPKGKMWEAGCNYLDDARRILDQVFHRSRPSTVQALLLLGYREFGIGSMEQAWIYIGMGIRMAIDLGLNCDSSKWKSSGNDLLNPEETQTRRQIWWICCLADRYGSMYMGRPISIHEEDFDTPLPGVDQIEENEVWQPLPSDPMKTHFSPVPSRVMSCFVATSKLVIILGDIMSHVYPVRHIPEMNRRAVLARLEARLDQWYISLPDDLRCDPTSQRVNHPPQILFLHVRYWGAVLLLNRGFIPNWKGEPSPNSSTLELKAFDLAQGAASHLSSIVTAYRERFTLKRTSPFFTSYILSAGVMHILTLILRPSNPQASLGLTQCLEALEDMEIVWPSARRAWELLNGVKLGFGPLPQSLVDRHKRHAEDAFGQEKDDHLRREPLATYPTYQTGHTDANGLQDLNTRLMAHMLGLDIPGIESSTSFYPGYEWWPRPKAEGTSSASQPLSPAVSISGSADTASTPSFQSVPFPTVPSFDNRWLQGNRQTGTEFPYDLSAISNGYGL